MITEDQLEQLCLDSVFFNYIKSLYEKFRNTVEENQAFVVSSDTLLPKLLSCEISPNYKSYAAKKVLG